MYPAEENRCGDYNINTFVIFECVLVYLSKKKCELGFLGLSKCSIMKDSRIFVNTNALYLVSHPENIFLSVCKAGRNVKPPLTHWGKIVNDPLAETNVHKDITHKNSVFENKNVAH